MINNDNEELARESEDIQATIEEVEKDVCVHILVVLQSVINEQISIRQLKKDTGNYIYQAVKDETIRKGWIV